MCSWCYAFGPVLERLLTSLPQQIAVKRLLGGLATDSDEPMPQQMQSYLQLTWRRIETRVPGIQFNFDFWHQCQPRRSTWRACRAVIAARQQNAVFDETMTRAIQQAYYQQARNPSDRETLIALAAEIGADSDRFAQQLDADITQSLLIEEMEVNRGLGVDSFPSLVLLTDDNRQKLIEVDYWDAAQMRERIESLL